MKTWLLALLALLALPPLGAQTRPVDPVLHRRDVNQVDEPFETRSTGRTVLPIDVSGDYALGSTGAVSVELQPDRLSGFLNRLGDRERDEGPPLIFFFATSRMSGQQISFVTHQVHGVWWSFEGTIVRGPA